MAFLKETWRPRGEASEDVKMKLYQKLRNYAEGWVCVKWEGEGPWGYMDGIVVVHVQFTLGPSKNFIFIPYFVQFEERFSTEI